MISGTTLSKKYRRLSVANIAFACLLGVVVVILAANAAGDVAMRRLQAEAHEALVVQVEALSGLLDKFRLLSVLLSHQEGMDDLFANQDSQESQQRAKKIALQAAAFSGAKDVVFLHSDGSILASGLNVITQDINPRSQLLASASQGRLGRGMRIVNENSRSYVFSSGIRKFGKYFGAVAVYVDLETFESHWSITRNPIMIVDDTGRIIMSNQEEWRLRQIDDIRDIRNGRHFFTLTGQGEYFDVFQPLPQLGWEFRVLADVTPATTARVFWGSFAGFLIILAALGTQLLINRQFEVLRRERHDRATSLRLERIVRDRTSELIQANNTLAHEVEERRHTEKQLRNTQNELIQTGKLAALGQMSTALSHEFNQPLSATKSYAANALKFLDLGRIDDVRENITRISSLSDRMADISKSLKNFARKPNSSFESVAVQSVVADAIDVLSSRLKVDKAQTNITMPEEDIWARSGHVRLQQVIVNLILNALDATSDRTMPELSIDVSEANKKVAIAIRDNGPGIDPAVLENVFDPFFTTKEVGKGLGLGLSISYNIVKDFGGQLSARNLDKGGAEFLITLNRGEPAREAAE